ncbi:MAG: DUF1156 domain-containing protein [Acidobacteria bacterium]|nr:DUF1156 domain-containing protein [Acidobacteriota bacterium]
MKLLRNNAGLATSPNYLDTTFDVAAVSDLSHRERSAFKPIYSMNKWWARRSSTVFRAILLGLSLSPGSDLMSKFYGNHQRDSRIANKIVLDPFMGGGTSVVEAIRLGYKAIGVDLNPLSWYMYLLNKSGVRLATCLLSRRRWGSIVGPALGEGW